MLWSLPPCCHSGGRREANVQAAPAPGTPAPLSPARYLPGTHLKDQLHDLRMHHAMHRLPVHVGDEVPRTEPCLLGRAPLFHVLGTGRHTVQG